MTRLKQARLMAGISQNELARRLKVKCPTVNTLEKKVFTMSRLQSNTQKS